MQVDNLKYTLLDKLISVSDIDLLTKISDLISAADLNKTVFHVSEKQECMLADSENDIVNGQLITNEALNLKEEEWLKV